MSDLRERLIETLARADHERRSREIPWGEVDASLRAAQRGWAAPLVDALGIEEVSEDDAGAVKGGKTVALSDGAPLFRIKALED